MSSSNSDNEIDEYNFREISSKDLVSGLGLDVPTHYKLWKEQSGSKMVSNLGKALEKKSCALASEYNDLKCEIRTFGEARKSCNFESPGSCNMNSVCEPEVPMKESRTDELKESHHLEPYSQRNLNGVNTKRCQSDIHRHSSGRRQQCSCCNSCTQYINKTPCCCNIGFTNCNMGNFGFPNYSDSGSCFKKSEKRESSCECRHGILSEQINSISNSPGESVPHTPNLYQVVMLQSQRIALLEKKVSKLFSLCQSKPVKTEVPFRLPTKEYVDKSIMTDFMGSDNKTTDKISTSVEQATRPKQDSISLADINVPGPRDVSPQTSIHIEMQEYNSSQSDSDSSSSSSSEEQVGWTFYDNVVDQVNGILNWNEHFKNPDPELRTTQKRERRKFNVVPELQSSNLHSKRVTFGSGSMVGESDTSLRINALATKYLDHQGREMNDGRNISMATFKYLERHCLLNAINSEQLPSKYKKKKSKKKSESLSKILDITAIKQQSKLLPKNL